MKKLIITAMILFSLNNLWSAPAPFAPSTVKAFADSLYSEGFLTQAEGEYKRYLFSVDTSLEDALSADVEFQSSLMSLCNIYKEQENKEGIVWLKQSFYPYAATTLKEKMNVLQAGYVFKERNLTSFSLLEQDFETEGISFSTDFTRVIKASDFVLNRNIKGLSEFCSEVSADTDLFGTLGQLSSSYKLKSPGLALFLSSIIPG